MLTYENYTPKTIKNHVLISRDGWNMKYKPPQRLTNEGYSVLDHAIAVYKFLMWPLRCFTYAELAEKIKQSYDITEPHNKACYDVLVLADGMTS